MALCLVICLVTEEQLETTKVYIKLIKEKNHLLENENRENVKKTFTLGYGKR